MKLGTEDHNSASPPAAASPASSGADSIVNAAGALLVVTPTLGTSPYLAEAVASVEALGIPVRHVLVSPGDQSAALAARFPACTVVCELPTSHGPYAAVNRVLAAALDWHWFTVINDDDRVDAGLARVVAEQCRPEWAASIAYGDLGLIGERGQAFGPLAVERDPRRFRALWRSGIVPLMQQGTLIGRGVIDRLGGFDERYALCADLDLWVRAVTAGVPFRHQRAHVADFRLRRGQLSANVAEVAHETQEIVATLGAPTRGVERWVIRSAYRARNAGRFAERLKRTGHVRTSRLYATDGPAAGA